MREKVDSETLNDSKMKKISIFTFLLFSKVFAKLSSSKAGGASTLQAGGTDQNERVLSLSNITKIKYFYGSLLLIYLKNGQNNLGYFSTSIVSSIDFEARIILY